MGGGNARRGPTGGRGPGTAACPQDRRRPRWPCTSTRTKKSRSRGDALRLCARSLGQHPLKTWKVGNTLQRAASSAFSPQHRSGGTLSCGFFGGSQRRIAKARDLLERGRRQWWPQLQPGGPTRGLSEGLSSTCVNDDGALDKQAAGGMWWRPDGDNLCLPEALRGQGRRPNTMEGVVKKTRRLLLMSLSWRPPLRCAFRAARLIRPSRGPQHI